MAAAELAMPRVGDWMETRSGRQFWPLSPHPSDIDVEQDIAPALSMMCRYNGQCLRFYTVAEHSVHLALWVNAQTGSRRLTLQALLHDGSEAYIADIVRPVKPYLKNYKQIEQGIMDCIMEAHGLPLELAPIVKEGDNRIIHDERLQNMAASGHRWVTDDLEPLNVTLQFWDPVTAHAKFLELYRQLT